MSKLPQVGDLVMVGFKMETNKNSVMTKTNTKTQARTVAAVYDHGGVLDSVGDVWQVKPEGVKRWQAVS